MYQFLLNLWVYNRVTEEQIQNYVTKGFITEQESNQILATPQVAEQGLFYFVLPFLFYKVIVDLKKEKGGNMIVYKINKGINKDGMVEKAKVSVYKDSEIIRKVDIKVGKELVVKPINKQKLKHRDRRVIITKFLEDKVAVKFVDTKRNGKVDIEDLDELV